MDHEDNNIKIRILMKDHCHMSVIVYNCFGIGVNYILISGRSPCSMPMKDYQRREYGEGGNLLCCDKGVSQHNSGYDQSSEKPPIFLSPGQL